MIGSADSGKTSLFAPIRGIVPAHRIGKITKQRQFNKAMMNRDCEVMFLDEATADLMDIDDWKVNLFSLQLSMRQNKTPKSNDCTSRRRTRKR